MNKYPSCYKNLTFLKKTYKNSIWFSKLKSSKFDIFDTFLHKNRFREKFWLQKFLPTMYLKNIYFRKQQNSCTQNI